MSDDIDPKTICTCAHGYPTKWGLPGAFPPNPPPTTAADMAAVAERCPLLAMYDVQSHSFDDEAAQNRKRGEVVRAVRDYVQVRHDALPNGMEEKAMPNEVRVVSQRIRRHYVKILRMLKEGE